jgi:predicted transcriptional regulator
VSKPEPSLLDRIDDDAEAAADARADADVAAGRVVSHEAMKRWLLSWGTPDESSARWRLSGFP